jgi:hypothetical protein
LAKPNTAGAVDATGHGSGNQWTQIERRHGSLTFQITGMILTVSHCLVLQWTFTPLIANRAVQRMIDQQKFHSALLRLGC